tara:strand:+ start:592 stop:1332 length:741 start_codon:yes stop_codon:yes gene_type:complete
MKILINGSTSGLGKKISEYYSRKKASLVCIGKNKMKIASLKKKVGSENLFFAIDLSKDKNLNYLKQKLKKIRDIDAIIHCMGGGFGLKDDLLSKKNFLELFNKNLFVQSELNNFIISKAIKSKKKLKIIHVSSIASIENVASVGYSTVKAALNVYSNVLSKKLISHNIDIKNIILGAFETKDNSFARLKKKNIKAYKKFRDSRMPLKRYNSAKEIIPVIDFLLEEKSKIISGDIIIDNREKNTFRN